MSEVPVNYWAILVCGVASMVLGSIWYGPLFGKVWASLSGFANIDEAKKQEMMKGMTRSYALTFIAALITAYILSHVMIFASSYMNVSASSAGVTSAIWMWLGFIAPVTLGSVLWEGKPWTFWVINNGHSLAQLLLFGIIIGYMM
jgi:hypothetical protein